MQSTCGLSIAARTRSVGLAVERRVERRHDPVELGEHLVVDVERPVGPDVRPRSRGGRGTASAARSTCFDLLPLRLQPAVAEVVRVVGDAEEPVPAARAAAAISSIVFLPSDDHVEWQCISPRRSPSSTSSGQPPCRARPRARRRSRAAPAGCTRSRGRRRALPRRGVTTSPVSTTVTPYSEIESPRRSGVLAQRDVVILRAGEVLEQVRRSTRVARRGGRAGAPAG